MLKVLRDNLANRRNSRIWGRIAEKFSLKKCGKFFTKNVKFVAII